MQPRQCFKVDTSQIEFASRGRGSFVLFLRSPPRSKRDPARSAYFWEQREGLAGAEPLNHGEQGKYCFTHKARLARDVSDFVPKRARGCGAPTHVLFCKNIPASWIKAGTIERLPASQPCCDKMQC